MSLFFRVFVSWNRKKWVTQALFVFSHVYNISFSWARPSCFSALLERLALYKIHNLQPERLGLTNLLHSEHSRGCNLAAPIERGIVGGIGSFIVKQVGQLVPFGECLKHMQGTAFLKDTAELLDYKIPMAKSVCGPTQTSLYPHVDHGGMVCLGGISETPNSNLFLVCTWQLASLPNVNNIRHLEVANPPNERDYSISSHWITVSVDLAQAAWLVTHIADVKGDFQTASTFTSLGTNNSHNLSFSRNRLLA